jgi:hypothetical protein
VNLILISSSESLKNSKNKGVKAPLFILIPSNSVGLKLLKILAPRPRTYKGITFILKILY